MGIINKLEQSIEIFKLDLSSRNMSEGTIQIYSNEVELFIEFTNHNLKCKIRTISRFREKHVDAYINFLENKVTEGDLKVGTLRKKIQALYSYFQFLVDEGFRIPFLNKLYVVKSKKYLEMRFETRIHKNNVVVLEEKEINAFRNALITIDNEFDRLRMSIALDLLEYTGIRYGELKIISTENLCYVTGELAFERPKNGMIGCIELDTKLIEKFKVLETKSQKLQSYKREKIFEDLNVRKYFRKMNSRAKTNIHPKDFRSTFATKLLAHDLPFEDVSKLLGHRDESTLKFYYEKNWLPSECYDHFKKVPVSNFQESSTS